MVKPQHSWLCLYIALPYLVFPCGIAQSLTEDNSLMVKAAAYLSQEFVMAPGSVSNKTYYHIDFPRNHIGIKSFEAEVVDAAGTPVPLQDVYLHHWVVGRYYWRIGAADDKGSGNNQERNYISVRNSGLCKNLGQYFGLGSETRRTSTHVPDPFAIEAGNPSEIPEGYEERWFLQVHAIDTRGVEDRLGCTECRCSLYNVTHDEFDRILSPDYEGGLHCCYDKTQCKLKKGFPRSLRRLYLRYAVKWIDWYESLVPARVYIIDVTDTMTRSEESGLSNIRHNCKIEYDVQPCKPPAAFSGGCTDTKRLMFSIPQGGYMIYGVAHQHSGGVGSSLYRKDGRVICTSMPIYGKVDEAGNEAGYIVGMSTCYPAPGSVRIGDAEVLVLESYYNSFQKHTGVMGLFYILIADEIPLR